MLLSKLAIKQPIFITMVLLALTLVGVLSYLNMGVELYPNMSSPTVNVSVSFSGASPQDVETLVTKPLEKALATISGVDSISSSSSRGSSNVRVSFIAGYSLEQGAAEVRESLDSIQRRLPSGASAPVMRRFDPSSSPFLTVALKVSGNLAPADLRQLIEQVIEPRLERVPGVAAVTTNGYPIQDIEVDLIANRLQALNVTPQQIVSALANQNVTIPSGSIINPAQNIPVRTSAQFQNLDEIGKVVVAQHGTQLVTLNDVATISPQIVRQTSLTRVNGQSTMVMEIQNQAESNVVQVAGLTRAELKSLSQDYPNLSFSVLSDNSTFIEQSDRDVIITMILGAILAALIVLLFIRNFRNTIITVAGLPIVILGTFVVLHLLGYTLNIITLMALSLSVGLLIDDAIVVRENIFRHMEHGESPREAADKGTGEIAFAVLAITLTIVAVFVPVAFTSGQIGSMFKEFGITVAVAVLISLFEAFTFAPLLTAYFAKPLNKIENLAHTKPHIRLFSKWANAWQSTISGYRHTLSWSLRHRLIIISLALLLFLGSIWVLRSFPISLFPTTNEGQVSISINLPPGNSLETTNQVVQTVEQVAMSQPEVKTAYARIGGGSNSYQGSVSLQLAGGAPTDAVISRLRNSLSQYSKILNFSKPSQFMGVGGLGGGGGGARSMPVQIDVQGPVDQNTLEGVVSQVMAALQQVPGIMDVRESTPSQQPELDITVDRQRCAAAGVSASTVGQTISILVGGTTATSVEWQGQLTDVLVQLQPQDTADTATLMALPVVSSSGSTYSLRDLATFAAGTGPTTLSRQNQQAIISVGANLQGRSLAEVVPDIQKALSGISLPAAITWKFGGQQAQAQNAYSSLIFALIIGLIFIYMVLASQFGSFIHPFTVMAALPLAIIGSVVLMVATHTGLTVISMIGIILMMGLATKNSILLVDFIINYRKQGRNRTEAVLEAGPVRLRPIIMTSLAIILGMIPTAMAIGAAGAFRAPMAIAVVGGVFSSTLLSLVVVPVVYTILDDAMVAVSRLFHRNAQAVYQPETNDSLVGGEDLNRNDETNFNDSNKHRGRGKWWFRNKP